MSLGNLLQKRTYSLLPWSGPVNVAVAMLLFAGITAVLFIDDEPSRGVSFLFVIPILLLAMQYGMRGALGGGALGLALFGAWNLSGGHEIGVLGALIRLLVLTAPALLVAFVDSWQTSTRERLTETDALLRAIADNMPDALYVLDEEGRYGLVNAAAAKLVGRSPEEMLGRRYADVLPPETTEALDSRRPGVTEDPDSPGRVDRIRLADGEYVFRSVTGPVTLPGGKGNGLFVMSHDITDAYRRETWLHVQHRIAESLVDAPAVEELPSMVLDLICDVDEVEWGAYWHRGERGDYRCLAVGGEEAPFAPGDRRPLTEMPDGFHVVWRDPRGERQGPTALVPVTEDGVAMVAYRTEVPDPETIERIFRPAMLMVAGYIERTRLAAEAERMKNEFFGLISHELRTPLTSIIGYADLLAELERDGMSERARHFVEVISRNARRELRLVQDLLLLVRLEAGTFSLERDVGNLTRIVEQSCEAVRPQAERNGIALAAGLEETGEIWGDAHRLGQAVDNLLTNAVKFSESGDTVSVRLEVGEDGESASIEVEDQGIGVPEDEVDRLFDRLFRASSAVTNQIQGTGLGLTIVKSVIEAHGGTVSVRSKVGEGTTFRIELPLTRPPQPSRSENGAVAGDGAGQRQKAAHAGGRD